MLVSTLRAIAPYAAGFLAAFLLHIVVGYSFGVERMAFYSKIAQDAGIAIILAVSLNMVNGFTGQFSMGHAAFMAIGGYTAAAFTFYGSHLIFGSAASQGGALSWALDLNGYDGPWFASGELWFVVALIAGGLAAAGAGWLVGLPSLRLRGDYLAIVTLGFGEIVRVLFQYSNKQVMEHDTIVATPLPVLATHLGGSFKMIGLPGYSSLFWIYSLAAVTVIVAYRLKHSSYGRAFLAIREDETAAEAMGVNTTKYKVRAFVLSAFFGGIAGGLFAHQNGSIGASEFGFMKSFEIIIIVVLGGLGSISGAALAAVLLTILPEALRDFASYRMIIYSLLLILLMILRPKGLFGVREIWELWPRRKAAAT